MLLYTISFVPGSLSSCLMAENNKNRGRINKSSGVIILQICKANTKKPVSKQKKAVGKNVTWKVFEIFMFKSFKILKIVGLRI